MSNAVTIRQLRSPSLTNGEFLQTPVYIGTAAKSVVVPMKPGVFSLAIPQAPDGTRYIHRGFKSKLRYWKQIGEYRLEKLSQDGLSITLTSPNASYTPSVSDLSDCTIFILENHVLKQTSYVLNCDFAFQDDSLILKDVRLTHKLMPFDNSAQIIVGKVVEVFDPEFIESDDTVNILSLKDQILIDGISVLVDAEYTFFYRVVDFRTKTLNYEDEVPDEYLDPTHASLSRLVKRHRETTNRPMTLCTLPEENVDDLLVVLSMLELDPRKYGYAITPAFSLQDSNNSIASFVSGLERNRIGFMLGYVWTPLFFEQILASSQALSHS